MPDATPPRPLTAPDVVAGLLADVAGRDERLADVRAERDSALDELAELREGMASWPRCPDGCGCRIATTDPEAAECGCGGPCTMECRENGYPDAPSYRDLAVRHVIADRDHLAAKLAETLAANQRWADVLGDVQQAGRERDDARSAFAKLAGHFTQGQSGWTARVSGTVLRSLCVAAMCEPPSGTGLEALAEASDLVAERDGYRQALEEIRDGDAHYAETCRTIAREALEPQP